LCLAFVFAGLPVEAGGQHHVHVPVVCPCQTVYRSGPEPEDLQVRIVGRGSSTIEAYFKDQLARYEIPGGIDICRYGAVRLAEKSKSNDLGTFAVLYSNDGFTAFGWDNGKVVPLTAGLNSYPQTGGKPPYTVQIDLVPGYPIEVIWVTSKVLRIAHGPCLDQVYIIRFDGGSQPWSMLYHGPVT
jgi:hypothetical protein